MMLRSEELISDMHMFTIVLRSVKNGWNAVDGSASEEGVYRE